MQVQFEGRGVRAAVMNGRAAHWVAALSYALLVLVMWAPYTLFSGLDYETLFPLMSETRSWFGGFFYDADPMRIHTNTFYHLSYLLGELTGVTGSYVPYQIVYAGLWWGRGMLVYLLVRRLAPACTFLAYVAGALALVHAVDGALQWVGQLNQFGMIEWMLLACFTALVAVDVDDSYLSASLSSLACLFQYMSLWSYESQLPLVLVFPAFVLAARWSRRRKVLVWMLSWYAVAGVYIAKSAQEYMQVGGGGYQKGVMRHDWAPASLASDWWFNVEASLSFWRWNRLLVSSVDSPLAGLAVFVFAAGALAFAYAGRAETRASANTPSPRNLLALLLGGIVALVGAFPVYLVLDGARGLWRTQFLSGMGAAVTMAAAIGLLSAVLPRVARQLFVVALAAWVVWAGTMAALGLGRFHRQNWEVHRAAVRAMLRAVPAVRPHTFVVLTGVPKDGDPFRDDLWYRQALQLAYPGIPVSGAYFLDDGSPGRSSHVVLEANHWRPDTADASAPSSSDDLQLVQTLVLKFEPPDRVTVVQTLPPGLCLSACTPESYVPDAQLAETISPIAARRFRVSAD